MLVIGIETSGLAGSVALTRDGEPLEARSLEQVGRRHAQTLVMEIRQILRNHHFTTSDVDAVAVSRGPGSFTGLRVGLVCAKTFAYATGCQFAAVDTFAVTAMNCPPDVRHAWIVEDAQRGDLVLGHYVRRDQDDWMRDAPIEIVCAEEWLPRRPADDVIVGRGLLRCDLSSLSARYLADVDVIQPRASTVALLGERMLQDRTSYPPVNFDIWQSAPFYMRPSAAEEVRAKRDASAGQI